MVKTFIKGLFRRAGYELKNTRYKDIFTIRQKMKDSFEQIKSVGFYPDLVIDIGAADGTPPLQECFPDAWFFWAEPLGEFEPALKKLKSEFKGEYVIGAIGKEKGEMDIHIQEDKVGSSLLEDNTEYTVVKTKRTVPVLTLEDIAKERFSAFSRILMKVDVQGFELEVLDGAGEFLNRVDVIILEVSLFKFLKGIPEFYEVVDYMKKRGFVVYDIIEGINRPLDDALGQKDLVFVKENGLFRQSHNWEKGV